MPPPPAPTPVSGLTDEEQAKVLLRDYAGMAEFAGACYENRLGLIDWIKRR